MDGIDRSLDYLDQSELEESSARAGHKLLRPIVLSLIHSSYLRTHTLSEFAGEVMGIVTTAVSVPVAFAEGFLRSFLSIESVSEDDSGRVIIRPRAGANEVDLVREVNELTAEIDPTAIYNPVVRERLNMVAEATQILMQQDLEALSQLSAEELSAALAKLDPPPASQRDREQEAAEVRRRMNEIRRSLRDFQATMIEAQEIAGSSEHVVPAGENAHEDEAK